MVPPNDDFEESVREEGHEAEEEVMKARKLFSHTGVKPHFLSRNYQEFDN